MAGVSQPTPLAAVRSKAQAMREAGHGVAAREFLTHALEWARPALGDAHPDVLANAHYLARLHGEAGDPAAARRVLEEALAAGQRRLGDADPLVLAMSYDLGMVAEELGNRHEARRNLRRVARHGPAVLGENHWAVRAARDYLGESGPADGTNLQPGVPPPPTTNPPVRVGWGAEQWPRHSDGPAYPQVFSPPKSGPPPSSTASLPAPRGRGATVAAVSAAMAALAATAVAAVALLDDPAPPPAASVAGPSAAPTLSGEPPGELRLHEEGSTITITWTDPTAGTVPFIIAGGRAGHELRPMTQVSPGDTSYRINGLNPRVDYCFTVAAVYSTSQFGVSGQVCTARGTRSPGATPT